MSNTFMQTPKRPNLPPTPITNCKPSLPPLSSILLNKDLFTTGYRLPSIESLSTPNSSRIYQYNGQHQFQHQQSNSQFSQPIQSTPIVSTPVVSTPVVSTPVASTLSVSTPSKGSSNYNNFSFANTSIEEDTPTDSLSQSKSSSPIESKAYAFISHSPATFPNQEPSIDNAPLARRKRRRTSPNELSILNKEFEIGSTPNKPRRIEIAKRVSMTEKAVQIWFQNKRQSLRKHTAVEKEVTEIPEATNIQPPPPMVSTSAPPILTASTPMKPILNKAQSFISPSTVTDPSPIQKRSLSTNSLPKLPFQTPSMKRVSIFENEDDDQLVLNETKKKQPTFLNSNSSSTMTFKLAPAKVKSPKKEISDPISLKREPLREISLNSAKRVKAKLDNIHKVGENECIENLLSLRGGNWK